MPISANEYRTARATRRVLLLLATSASCLALGCQRSSASNGDVAIGVALDPLRPGMQSIYNGVELAIDELNAQKGVHFVERKGPPDLRTAVPIATFMQKDRSVVGIVGHPESGTTLDAMPVYSDEEHNEKNAVPVITPTGTSAALTGANRWLFRICPSDLASSAAVAHYALDSLHARRAAVIYRNDAYGKDWSKSFAETFEAGGGTVVENDPYLADIIAWDAYAGLIKQENADVLLFPGSAEDAVPALQALRSIGVTIPFVGGDATSALEQTGRQLGKVHYVAFFLARNATTDKARAFVDAYTHRFGVAPDQRAALAYDAAMLIGEGVHAVGPDRHRLRDWLEGVGTARPDVDGVAGPIHFDAKHDATNKPVHIATVAQGPAVAPAGASPK